MTNQLSAEEREKPNERDREVAAKIVLAGGDHFDMSRAWHILAAYRIEIAAEALEEAAKWHEHQAELADERVAAYRARGHHEASPQLLASKTKANEHAVYAQAIRALATRRSQADNELEDAVLECSAAATAEAEEVRRETLQQAADVCSPEVGDWCDCRKKVLALMAHQHRFVTDEDGAVHPCACGEAYK